MAPNEGKEMNYTYTNGQEVNYDNGVVKGKAMVLGYATTEMPVIGAMLILEDLSSVLPTDFEAIWLSASATVSGK